MEAQKSRFLAADSVMKKIVKYYSFIAVAAVIVMGFIAAINVVSTKVFGWSIQITNEVVKYFMVPTCLCLLAEIQINGGLMQVDLFSRKYGPGMKRVTNIAACILGILVFSLASWRNIVLLEKNIRLKEMSAMSRYALPIWPFTLICVISMILLVVVFIWSIIREFKIKDPDVRKEQGKEEA